MDHGKPLVQVLWLEPPGVICVWIEVDRKSQTGPILGHLNIPISQWLIQLLIHTLPASLNRFWMFRTFKEATVRVLSFPVSQQRYHPKTLVHRFQPLSTRLKSTTEAVWWHKIEEVRTHSDRASFVELKTAKVEHSWVGEYQLLFIEHLCSSLFPV